MRIILADDDHFFEILRVLAHDIFDLDILLFNEFNLLLGHESLFEIWGFFGLL
jgi:hypothetical protein